MAGAAGPGEPFGFSLRVIALLKTEAPLAGVFFAMPVSAPGRGEPREALANSVRFITIKWKPIGGGFLNLNIII